MPETYRTITGEEISLDNLNDEENLIFSRLFEVSKIRSLEGLPPPEIAKIQDQFEEYILRAIPNAYRKRLSQTHLNALLEEGARSEMLHDWPLVREASNTPLGKVAADIRGRIEQACSSAQFEIDRKKQCFFIHVGQSPDKEFHFSLGTIRYELSKEEGFRPMLEEGHNARGRKFRGHYLFPPCNNTELALQLIQTYGQPAENLLTGIFERAFHSVGEEQGNIGVIAVSSDSIDHFLIPENQAVLDEACDNYGSEAVSRVLLDVIGLGLRLGVLRRKSEK